MHILLTNDDSHDSPLFLQMVAKLQHYGRVTVVVPAQEQSWQGKSMTRYGPLYVDQIDLHGYRAWSVTGTPADCVNLALYNLMDEWPDLVISGVNLGVNTGLGFAMASGTLGACFEGNIAGLPGLALSQEISFEDHKLWDAERRFTDEAVQEMSDILDRLLPVAWAKLVHEADPHATTWSINMPRHLRSAELVAARLGRTFYGKCFKQRGDHYHHSMERFELDPDEDTDYAVLRTGRASVTRLDLTVLGQ